MTLKQQGAFVCRSLSFQQCSFELVVTPMEGLPAGEAYDKARDGLLSFCLNPNPTGFLHPPSLHQTKHEPRPAPSGRR